jgi:hypothetical protein
VGAWSPGHFYLLKFMSGFSFLVSPQSQEQSKETAQSFRDAYDRATAGREAAASQQAAADREDARQTALQARAKEHEQAAFLMQANQQKAMADRYAEQNKERDLRAFSLTSVKDTRDLFNNLMTPVTKQIEALDADKDNRFDPTWKASYIANLRAAQVNDYQTAEGTLQSFLANHREGDTPHIDFGSMKSLQLTAALANPDYVDAVRAKTANTQNLIATRNARIHMAEEKVKKETMGAYDKKTWDNYVGANTYVSQLQDQYGEYVRTHPGVTPNDPGLAALQENLNKAKTAFAVSESQFKSAALMGRFGATAQTAVGAGEGIGITTPNAPFQGVESTTTNQPIAPAPPPTVATPVQPQSMLTPSAPVQDLEVEDPFGTSNDPLNAGIKSIALNPPRGGAW